MPLFLCPHTAYNAFAPFLVYDHFSYASRPRLVERWKREEAVAQTGKKKIIEVNMVVREPTRCVKALILYVYINSIVN